MAAVEHQRDEAAAFGNEHLFTSRGNSVKLSNGYIPLLVNYTYEDKAAKGLRKREAGQSREVPIYFTALEALQDHKITLFSGISGSGKTTFAKYLAFQLATRGSPATTAVPRNDHGNVFDEIWQMADLQPSYFTVDGPDNSKLFISSTLPNLLAEINTDGALSQPRLVIVDNVENAGKEAHNLLTTLHHLAEAHEHLKFLLLGDSSIVKKWNLSTGISRYDLLPLLRSQRQQALRALSIFPDHAPGLGAAASMPAFFALAVESGSEAQQAEDLLESWLNLLSNKTSQDPDVLARAALENLRRPGNSANEVGFLKYESNTLPHILSSKAVQQILAARHLYTLPWDAAVQLYDQDPTRWEPTLHSLLSRTVGSSEQTKLIDRLLDTSNSNKQLSALLVSGFLDEPSEHRQECIDRILSIINGPFPLVTRDQAGRALARLGDPRDLTALAEVPDGTSIQGSTSHPNSQPLEQITVPSFRIGIYPVVNKDYSVFVKETNRLWQSPDGNTPERRNVPATDLTWHDANAYCAWLTDRWHATGKIEPSEVVRLPTEPEWERAALSYRTEKDGEYLLWPWGTEWEDESANYEGVGLNTTCSVGLFPKGRSHSGCFDMAGQIWEWCSTLWGNNMATPSFRYPWKYDGRESSHADDSVRRVLRGGCFSSGRTKITGTYRGSLEAGGFWRGNGFRVVVASTKQQ